MTNNRRNLYRVLHVQPDAPLEVIRSSWRTLQSRLRQHPDLGGTHAQAVLINQAWEVLSDGGRCTGAGHPLPAVCPSVYRRGAPTARRSLAAT